MEIWIVDDAFFMRNMLEYMISTYVKKECRDKIVTIREFENGKQVVEAYKLAHEKKEKIDLIFMDITMPVMDGIDASKEIFSINPSCPIIIISSLSVEEKRQEALSLDIKTILNKPFLEKEVEKITESLLYPLEYDENGNLCNMKEEIFLRLLSKRKSRLSDLIAYFRSDYDFSSPELGQKIIEFVQKSKDKTLLSLLVEHGHALDKKTLYTLKGFRIRELTNVNWKG